MTLLRRWKRLLRKLQMQLKKELKLLQTQLRKQLIL